MSDILIALGLIWVGAIGGFVVAALCCAAGKADE